MTAPEQKGTWASGAAYERYVGRWSRLVAREFLAWLAIRPGACWLDIGCGTAALSQTILYCSPGLKLLRIDTRNMACFPESTNYRYRTEAMERHRTRL